MKIDVVMPKMGESINEGTIIKWYKKKGDAVEKDEIIFEISTDKVDTEIPSPDDGILSEIKVFENETVEVDTVVAIIETEGSASQSGNEEEAKPEPVKEAAPEEVASTAEVGGEVVDIPMPKMGESVMEGTIIKWNKEVGDPVEVDEIIFEISTDKVDTEVPSPVEGTISEILFGENDTVEVGVTVAKVTTSGGVRQSVPASSKKEEPAPKQEAPAQKSDAAPVINSSVVSDTPQTGRFYSPLVMNIASKEDVSHSELEMIKGSGVSGRVTKKDILAYLEERKSGKAAPVQQQSKPQSQPVQQAAPEQSSESKIITPHEGIEVIPMDNIRKRIMYHMINSRDTSVHVTAVIEVDLTKIHNFLKAKKQSYLEKTGVKLTYLSFIAYSAIKALKEYPLLNASIENDNILVKHFVNLGVAVAVEPNGLIVPNIKNADEKNIKGLAREIIDLSYKARNKQLMPDNIMDGTFTLTNYGTFGSLFGTPIINQPEVGILGVGAVTKKPVVVEFDGADTIAIKPMMYLSLSHDHRLVDGMLGGKFLRHVKDTLENFDTNLV